MRGIVRWMLSFSYYFSQLLGVLPFSYNLKTGRVRTTRSLTLYSIAANVYTFLTIPLLISQTNLKDTVVTESQLLHQIIYAVMTVVRIIVVLISLILNWWQRAELIALIRAFQRLRRRRLLAQLPKRAAHQRHFDRVIMRKFCYALLSDVALLGLSLEWVRPHLNWRLTVGITSLSLLTYVLNVVMNHYFLGVQHINLQCRILNDELARILRAATEARASGAGVYMTKCCMLSDQLDALAIVHRQLHVLANRINALFRIQGACIILNLYMNSIGTIYLGYTLAHPQRHTMQTSLLGWCLVAISAFAYYNDIIQFITGMLELLEVFNTSAVLLRTQLALPLLDVRLEQSFENFLRQIAVYPLEMNLLGLFKFNKEMAFAIFSSAITNSTVLLQYDYKKSL